MAATADINSAPKVLGQVPERPALAPGVELRGELQESGFAEPQWLIEREGRFVQVSELLYRVAEQIDGQRTLDDIAEGLTQTTRWTVTAEHVYHILQAKLVPLGLFAAPDGSGPRLQEPARSALQVRLRVRVLSAQAIDSIAAVLQRLYTPAVLIPALVLLAAAHVWLYFVHGTSDGLRLALYTPGGLLLVVALMVVSGVVHEFGHAAGLRYGGGRARGIGAGVYLIYPTFYTDTSDAYRLGRWARVRTDLGGIYFHLLFAVALIGVYLMTGEEVLLAAVVLINADVLYQLVPIARLDGYWALTDFAGVPDFFSQMRPFLRRTLRRSRGALPALNPRAKLTFSLFILATAPILALWASIFVLRFPQSAQTTLDALQLQAENLGEALQAGAFLAVAAIATQIVLLSLFALAIVYLLSSLGRSAARGLWRWSRPTPLRRLTGVAAASALVAALGFAWTPQFFSSGPTPSAAPAGTRSFDVEGRAHVKGRVAYAQTPPVGGDHAPVWQNCGFYAEPVPSTTAVHSLEHGAIWITYRPELASDELRVLEELADRQSYIIVSPARDLPARVVASAWSRQLRLDSARDPRLVKFINAFRLSPNAPEPAGGCTGGVGRPPRAR